MTWRLQYWLPTSGKEEKTSQERVKGQSQDPVEPKPFPQLNPHAWGRGKEQGGSRSPGLLNTSPWRSAPGACIHITWCSSDYWGWATKTGRTGSQRLQQLVENRLPYWPTRHKQSGQFERLPSSRRNARGARVTQSSLLKRMGKWTIPPQPTTPTQMDWELLGTPDAPLPSQAMQAWGSSLRYAACR